MLLLLLHQKSWSSGFADLFTRQRRDGHTHTWTRANACTSFTYTVQKPLTHTALIQFDDTKAPWTHRETCRRKVCSQWMCGAPNMKYECLESLARSCWTRCNHADYRSLPSSAASNLKRQRKNNAKCVSTHITHLSKFWLDIGTTAAYYRLWHQQVQFRHVWLCSKEWAG